MELPTHPQWSPCGHGELFIYPDWIISFFLSNPCPFIALSVPNCTKNTQPLGPLYLWQSNNILSYLFGSVWICWEKLNEVKWREMGRDWKILWLDDEPPSQLAVMGKYSKVREKKYWICFRTQLFFSEFKMVRVTVFTHPFINSNITNNQTWNVSRPEVV